MLHRPGGTTDRSPGECAGMDDHCDDVQCRACQADAWSED
jgi:hypothetical protein